MYGLWSGPITILYDLLGERGEEELELATCLLCMDLTWTIVRRGLGRNRTYWR